MIRLAAAFLLLMALATHAVAEKRVALVLGNGAYERVAPLANPENDANVIADALLRLEFEVIEGTNLTRVEFVEKIREFARAMQGADLALLYFAGHGLQVNGRNYLAPVETELLDETDLEFETIRLDMILAQMERQARTNLVFLDACRNNPLARNLAQSMGTRSASVGRGLAPIETGVGTLIAFSTQPGNVALDGEGSNSPFTEALARHIETPGEDIGVLMRRVRQDVIKKTGGRQVPWDNSSLTGSVILNQKSEESAADRLELETEIAKLREQLEAATGLTATQQNSAALQKPVISINPAANRLAPESDTENSQPGDRIPLDLDRQQRRAVQLSLREFGVDPGPADGEFGPKTYQAILAARKTLGIPIGTHVDQMLIDLLPTIPGSLTRFDGLWTISRTSDHSESCGMQGGPQILEIKDGEVSGPGYAGEVFDNESIRFTRTFIDKRKKQQAEFVGTIAPEEGNGTFETIDGKCRGRFALFRGNTPNRAFADDLKDDRDLVTAVQKQLNRLGCSVGTADGVWGNRSELGLASLRKHGGLRFANADLSYELLNDLNQATPHLCPITCPDGTHQSGSTCLRFKSRP
ncbi:MAG: caspase family protein [Pseudomonadota bacterium]